MVKTAVIMTGGLGTRLGKLTADMPKPMLNVAGKPFLDYLIKNVVAQGIRKIIFSVSYKSEQIINFCKTNYNDLELLFSVEEYPLGTGGGLKKAFDMVEEDSALVLNGDTYSQFNLVKLMEFYSLHNADVCIVLKYMKNASRYGIVELDESLRITKFAEKSPGAVGFINSGVCLLRKSCFDHIELKDVFSFESDFLSNNCKNFYFYGLDFPGYFIDIGVVDDYQRAQEEFKQLL